MKQVMINIEGKVFCSEQQSLFRPCSTDAWLNSENICNDCPMVKIKLRILTTHGKNRYRFFKVVAEAIATQWMDFINQDKKRK